MRSHQKCHPWYANPMIRVPIDNTISIEDGALVGWDTTNRRFTPYTATSGILLFGVCVASPTDDPIHFPADGRRTILVVPIHTQSPFIIIPALHAANNDYVPADASQIGKRGVFHHFSNGMMGLRPSDTETAGQCRIIGVIDYKSVVKSSVEMKYVVALDINLMMK